ncbi:MAG TPA: ATP-binding protein [Bacteroidia bacterium]|nr:ATP-binding protein [Bacteroidia bacterium]
MMMGFDKRRNVIIGTVEFVSPKEIKVLLEIEAPQSTSINTGIPHPFPRINGFLLIPNESGAIIGLITWIGIEYSPYPKRKGYKDFDLIDLPFPLRKISLAPIGTLKGSNKVYEIERGVYSYPSVGDNVIIPSQEQLKAIIQNKDKNAKIKIGTSPLAANAPVYVDPDKLFGRHLAILGNTGSGKSCSVAGLIRWSLEAAGREINNKKQNNAQVKHGLNARFIILDPNGEYTNSFDDLGNVKKYEVKLNNEDSTKQLKIPAWMWNSWEWASISQASVRTQRPILRRALKEIKNANDLSRSNESILFKNFVTSMKISLLNYQKKGVEISEFPGKQHYGEFLENVKKSLDTFNNYLSLSDDEKKLKDDLINKIQEILRSKPKNNKGYYPAFNLGDLNPLLQIVNTAESSIGELKPYEGPDEDSPVFFKIDDFLAHIERLAQEQNQQQYLDFFIMRVRSLFTDKRIASVTSTETKEELTLIQWLNDYIGNNDNHPSITIIDLSLLPAEILYLIVSVLTRLIFEAHHRYKKVNGEMLPTVLVVDEAHNLIKRYEISNDTISSQQLCTQVFEKIAKEGRKFGLGLVLASQRPSELSQTVLSQCNTFLLHRIVSDRDQEMVKKLVPDSMGGILNELPVLPTRKAILIGWAAPIPVLIEMNELKKEYRPQSRDPDFWEVWTNKKERKIKWEKIVEEWQGGKGIDK